MAQTCTPTTVNDSVCYTTLSMGEAVGIAFNVQTGLMSGLAVLILLGFVARNVMRNIKDPPPHGWKFIRTHVDCYFLSLLLSDLVHAVSSAMDMRWVHRGQVFCGMYCTVQGAIRNLATTSIALGTLAISVHTFIVIFFRWTPPRGFLIPTLVIAGSWLFVVLFVALEAGLNPKFYTPTPYWCWISNRPVERIVGQYLWLWTSLGASMALYGLLFLSLRGNISVDPGNWRDIQFHRHPQRAPKTAAEIEFAATSDARAQAMSMLLYPVCYSLLVLPLSIVRWVDYGLERHGHKMPFVFLIIGPTIFGLSGVVNVVLLLSTRPTLLTFGQRRNGGTTEVGRDDVSARSVLFISPEPGGTGGGGGGGKRSASFAQPDLRLRRLNTLTDDADSDMDDHTRSSAYVERAEEAQ